MYLRPLKWLLGAYFKVFYMSHATSHKANLQTSNQLDFRCEKKNPHKQTTIFFQLSILIASKILDINEKIYWLLQMIFFLVFNQVDWMLVILLVFVFRFSKYHYVRSYLVTFLNGLKYV